MLTDLQIRRFRGIESLSLAETGTVNLIVGRNDTGKTTMLEAVRLLLSGDPRHLPRWSQINRTSHEARFIVAFYRMSEAEPIEIQGKINGLSLRTTASISEIKEEQLDIDLDRESDETGDSLLEPGKSVVVEVSANGGAVTLSVPLVKTYSRTSLPSSTKRTFTGALPKVPSFVWLGTNRFESFSLVQRYSELYRSGGADVIELLSEVEPSIEGLVVLTRRDDFSDEVQAAALEVKLNGQPPLPIESIGEGFSSIVEIVSAIASARSGLCLIDEIENGIHYSILPRVWKVARATAKSYNSRVWATTHSLDCVHGAYEAFAEHPEELRVHRLERQTDGNIVVHTFDHDMLGRAFERGLEVR